MTKIIIIEKTGVVKESDVKLNDLNDLYKKAGFKTAQGFQLQTTWISTLKKCQFDVSLYAKTSGRAGQENKYDFPPPVDDKLFFGSCVLLAKNYETEEMIDLTKEQWNQYYEHLFGGFEDLGEEDSELSEDDVDDDVSRTKEGYVKDGFIVDDSELELEDDEEEEEEDDEEEEEEDDEEDFLEEEEDTKKSKKSKKPMKTLAKVSIRPKNAFVEPTEKKSRTKKTEVEPPKNKLVKNNSLNYLNCSDELEEEDYI